MLKVLFFASVKEELDCSALEIPWDQSIDSLDRLQARLIRDGGPSWRVALERKNMIRAVNHDMVTDNSPLKDGDEVAFFPPVTGG
ncbi:MAG: molybdopterin converting factor subunit 1 [Pseudomonadota bacterium]